MAARDGRALEVVVMATSGWGQSHELATYERVGRGFAPDLVVAFFCPNDLWNNLIGVEGKEGPPVYSLDPAGNLVSNLDEVAETPPTPAQIEKHLRQPRFPGLRVARRLVRESYRILRGEGEGAAKAAALGELPEAVRGEARRGPRGIPADKQVMFEKLVREMKQRIVDRDGHRMWVVLVNGDARHEPKRPYRRMMSWVADTYTREGLEVIDLDPLFRERARREQRYPAWENDLHWNETGHAWVAETLYARSEPLLGAGSSRLSSRP
jgi:lysophospholipase L1-like esterase